ncbi:MAG: class I SAM-dependent methyltransferase [Bacteroidetes bacterium]|nr:class I SAM-dependent methyltransferase [Bacteroidota bacterium]
MTATLQEQLTNAAFSKQAPVFDHIDEHNSTLRWMRHRVHDELLRFVKAENYLLELNCGTGMDAMFLAQKGLKVLATDNAEGMIAQLQANLSQHQLQHSVTTRHLSFLNLDVLGLYPQFDYVFSNFGGLNCTDRLDKVLHDIDGLLKPGGYFTLVLMPRICPWEFALIFRGFFKTAFRRLKKGGLTARVEGLPFQCYYYNPGYIVRQMEKHYRLCSLKSLGLAIPPPYLEQFAEKHPGLFRSLETWELRLAHRKPFRNWGDHFMITMQKM